MLTHDEMEALVTLLLNKSPMERLKHTEAEATIRIMEANGYTVAKKHESKLLELVMPVVSAEPKPMFNEPPKLLDPFRPFEPNTSGFPAIHPTPEETDHDKPII